MKMKRKFFVTLIVAILGMVAGCKPSFQPSPEPSTPTGTSSFISSAQPVNQTFPSPTPTPAEKVEKEPLLLFFLLDSSGSVIGKGEGDKCDPPPEGDLPIHRQALRYLFEILNNLEPTALASLQIGIGRFGDSYTYNEQYFRGDEIRDKYSEIDRFISQDPNNDRASHYEEGLAEALKSIEEYSIESKHMFLFTDGFLQNGQKDAVEVQIEPYHEKRITLHVALICPEKGDTEFWPKHSIDTWENGPSQWMSSIFDLLGKTGYLPKKSGWISGPQQISIDFSPYATEGWVHYYDLGGQTKTVFIDDKNRFSEPYRLSLSPVENCELKPLKLSLNSDTNQGFWWAEERLMNPPAIQLDVPPQVVNRKTVSITAHLMVQGLPSDQLRLRRRCFDLQLRVLSQDGNDKKQIIQIIPCEDEGDGLCPEKGDSSLYRTWNWTPQYESPQKVEVMVTWSSPWRDPPIQKTVSVLFSPTIVEILKNHDSSQEIVKFKFRSQEDVLPPKIYLQSGQTPWAELTDEAHKSNPQFFCPYPAQPSPWGDDLELSEVREGKLDLSKQQFFSFSVTPMSQYQKEYVVTAYKYIFSACQTSTVVFMWEASDADLQASSVWRCPLDAQSLEIRQCEPKP